MALYVIAGLALASAVDTHDRSVRSERANDRLQAVERAQTADQAARQRRDQIRQQVTKQAQIDNAAATAGQSSSSAPLAADAGIQSSVNENIGSIDAAVGFGNAKSNLRQDIFNLQQPSNINLAAGVATSIFETPKIKVT